MQSASDIAPIRPGIPPLLLAALTMWAACASAYAACMNVEPKLARYAAIAGMALTVIGMLPLLVRQLPSAFLIIPFTFLGIGLGCAGATSYANVTANLPDGQRPFTFELASDPKTSPYGMYVDAKASDEEGFSERVRVYLESNFELLAGERFNATCSLSPVKEASRESCYASGIVATCNVRDPSPKPAPLPLRLVHDVRAKAIRTMGEYAGDAAGVMQALVCGYRPTIQDNGEYELFKQCGLAHIVAVSGAHLAIVVMVFGSLLSMIHAPRRLTFTLSTAFVLAYLTFAGIPISAVRAAIMVLLAMASGLFGRRNASLNSLAVCVMTFLTLDPVASVSVSLFLSAASTLGIILLASLASSWFSWMPSALKKAVGEPLGLTISANVATLPCSASLFSQLPIIAPLANVIATPLFTLGCTIGLVCALAACAFEPLAPLAMGLGALAVTPLRASVTALSSIPYASVAISLPIVPMIMLSAVLVFTLWHLWPRLGIQALAVLSASSFAIAILVIILPGIGHGDEMVMLNVGQGDAILVRSESSAMLVDTGNKNSMLREELAKQGITHLDAVLVTHPDDDHCGSLSSLAGYVLIDRFVCASDMLECTCDKCNELLNAAERIVGANGICGIEAGMTIDVGRFSMQVVWPYEFADEGGNADSLCLLAGLDCDHDGSPDWKALLTGDAESEQLEAMAEAGTLEDVDVLKVGHHGSKISLNDKVADILKPEVALVSVGENNRYGHPSQEILDMLARRDVRIFRTDESGTITVSFAKEGMRVE